MIPLWKIEALWFSMITGLVVANGLVIGLSLFVPGGPSWFALLLGNVLALIAMLIIAVVCWLYVRWRW